MLDQVVNQFCRILITIITFSIFISLIHLKHNFINILRLLTKKALPFLRYIKWIIMLRKSLKPFKVYSLPITLKYRLLFITFILISKHLIPNIPMSIICFIYQFEITISLKLISNDKKQFIHIIILS